MRTPTLILMLLAALLATPVHSAQTPTATQADGTLMQLTVDELPPDLITTTGMIRTTYPAGATLRLVTGSGPSLHFVESGTLTVTIDDGEPPLVVRAGAQEGTAMPETAEPGREVVVTAGDGFLLAPGTTAEIRNDGPTPAAVLDLLDAPDLATEVGEGIAQAILVRQEVTLPEPPVSVTLSRTTLEPGDRLSLAEAPTLSAYAAVEREQSYHLSGQGVNRATEPLDVYVLLIAPGAASRLAQS